MHIIFLLLVIIYLMVTAVSDARKTKELIGRPITEKVRVKFYIETIILGWASVLAVMAMCVIAKANFEDIGFRLISLNYNIWFSIITFVLCGVLLLGSLYQVVSYLTNAKYREAIKEKFAGGTDENQYDAVVNLLVPRSKKEKQVFFWVSLTAGVGEEILLRGFLFYLLGAIFPGISMIVVVLISGALFGIWHLYQGLQGVIRTTISGILFGCLFLASGSLIPAILLHFLLDLSSAFLLAEE